MRPHETRIEVTREQGTPGRWMRARSLLRGAGALDRQPRDHKVFYTAFAGDTRVYTRGGCRLVQDLARDGEPAELWTGYQWAPVRVYDCERAHTSYCVYSSGGARVACGHKQSLGVLAADGTVTISDSANIKTGDTLLPFSPPAYEGCDVRAPMTAAQAEKFGGIFGDNMKTRHSGASLDAGAFGNSPEVAVAFLHGWASQQRGHIMGKRDVLAGLVAELAAVGITRTVVLPAHGDIYELHVDETPDIMDACKGKLLHAPCMSWSIGTSRADVVRRSGRQRMYRCKIVGDSPETPHTLLVNGIVVLAPADCDGPGPEGLPPTPTVSPLGSPTSILHLMSPIAESGSLPDALPTVPGEHAALLLTPMRRTGSTVV